MREFHEPPAGYKPNDPKELREKGVAWCPYCGRESEFGYDSRRNNARCMGCGISERDFYVRRFNRLWNDKALEAFVAGAVKSGRKWSKPYPWEKNKEAARQVTEPAKARAAYCDLCGKEYTATGNRQKYCEDCAAEVRRQKLAEYKREERSKKDRLKSRGRYDQGTLLPVFRW